MAKFIDRKLLKILELQKDADSIDASLKAVSPFFDKEDYRSLDAGKSLRQNLESENQDISLLLLNSFEKIKIVLEELEIEVDGLDKGIESISDRLKSGEKSMHLFTERAQALGHQRRQLYLRANHVNDFISKFQLSPEEENILIGADSECTDVHDYPQLTGEFFNALQHLKSIYKDCSELVGSQSAGFELLDSLSRNLETAYERLYNWVQRRCRDEWNEDEFSEADTTLQVALKTLRDRPMFFNHCKESIANSRRKLLAQRFFEVTATGQGYMEGAESVRYIADLLAWIHQASVAEHDLLLALLGPDLVQIEEDKDEMKNDSMSNLSIGATLSSVMDGITDSFMTSITNILDSCNDSVVAYRLLGFIVYYSDTIRKVLDYDGELKQALTQIRAMCFAQLDSLLSSKQRILANSSLFTPNLGPTGAVIEAARHAQDMIQASVLLPFTSAEEYSLAKILGAVIVPPLENCLKISREMEASDSAIFVLNNMDLLNKALQVMANVQKDEENSLKSWIAQLSGDIDKWLDSLKSSMCTKILDRCGIRAVIQTTSLFESEQDPNSQLSDQPGMEDDKLRIVFGKFYSAIFALQLNELESLQAPDLRGRARQLIVYFLADEYENVYNLLRQETSGYKSTSFLIHSPAQVRIILDCDE